MNRDDLASQAPKWSELQSETGAEQWSCCIAFVESILHAIVLDVREPDVWEAMCITRGMHALVEGQYARAITFLEMALLVEPGTQHPPRLRLEGEPLRLADLELALDALKSLGAPYGNVREGRKPAEGCP